MESEAIKNIIVDKWPEAVALEGGEWLNIQVPAGQWRELAVWLRDEPSLNFDYLFCLTCVDWLQHLTMVYHLRSTKYHHSLVVKSDLDRTTPEIHTVSDVWRTADFHEREVFEMYGVKFINHHDLRNLILPDVWDGYPMRKDYEDPINMIKL